MNVYAYLLKREESWWKWWESDHRSREDFHRMFWRDIIDQTYFRILSHFHVRTMEDYVHAASTYYTNPDRYFILSPKHQKQYDLLLQSHPELFI